MAGELQLTHETGATIYFIIRNRIGQIWNTSGAGAFENFNSAQYAVYDVAATEQGTSGSAYYTADMPSAIPAGIYSVVGVQQIGAAPVEYDRKIATGDFHWNGSVSVPLSDLATSGQVGQFAPIRLARGVMLQNFLFKLVSAADHVTPFTSGVVSGQIARDNGNFGALQSGAFTEVGLGWYRTNLTSGDLLANTAALCFTATGVSGGSADPRDFALVLQRTSGV